jgi:seryl-tRNA synthetase
MLDIKFIRENSEAVKKNCENRNIKCDIDLLLKLDEKRKLSLKYIEELNAEKNKLNLLIQKSDGSERKELI